MGEIAVNKTQLRIDVDAETKQLVEAAAAEKNISVNDYLLSAVQHELANDGLVAIRPPLTKAEALQLANDMRELRESILAERNGELIDVNAILDQIRDERDGELYNLH